MMWSTVNIWPMGVSERRSYHHGDLRNALVRSAAVLAEQGGPESVTVRATARDVGVSPTAAYRHFAGHEGLLAAIKDLASEQLAAAMSRSLAEVPPAPADPVRGAVHHLEALGRGYLAFALAEPGLFRTAFCRDAATPPDPIPGELTQDPYGLLSAAIDALVEVGYLAATDRPHAEVAAWSTVHGLALLMLDGPLRDLPPEVRHDVQERVLRVVVRGLGTAP